MAKLPESDWLSLQEAVERTQALFDSATPAEVADALRAAFHDGKIQARDRCQTFFKHDALPSLPRSVWDRPEVQWEINQFRLRNSTHPYARPEERFHVFTDVKANRSDLNLWLALWKPATPEAIFEDEPDYREVTNDMFSLDDAICFLLGIHLDRDRQFWTKIKKKEFRRIERLATRSIQSKTLTAEQFAEQQCIWPSDFLDWARSKGLPIPPRMEEAVRQSATLPTSESAHEAGEEIAPDAATPAAADASAGPQKLIVDDPHQVTDTELGNETPKQKHKRWWTRYVELRSDPIYRANRSAACRKIAMEDLGVDEITPDVETLSVTIYRRLTELLRTKLPENMQEK